MGLKSLPVLNKCGVSMFWNNVWDSIKLHKKYNHSLAFLHDFIYFFLIGNFYIYYVNSCTVNNRFKSFKKINYKKLKLKKVFIGRITFFKYQNWTISNINFLTTRIKKVKLQNLIKTKNKFLLNSIFTNKFKTNQFYNNYKYKFKNR